MANALSGMKRTTNQISSTILLYQISQFTSYTVYPSSIIYTVGCLQVFFSLHPRHVYITELLRFLSTRNLRWRVLAGTTLGVIQLHRVNKSFMALVSFG